MKVEIAGGTTRVGAGGGKLLKIEADGEFQRLEQLRLQTIREVEGGEAIDEPFHLVLLAARGINPFAPGHVGLDSGIFVEQRNDAGQRVGEAGGVELAFPVNADVVRILAGKPCGDREFPAFDDFAAGDAGNGFVVKEGKVDAEFFQFGNAGGSGCKKVVGDARNVAALRKCAQKEQGIVPAQQALGV